MFSQGLFENLKAGRSSADPGVGLSWRLREIARRPLQRLRGELTAAQLSSRGLRLGQNVYIGTGTKFDNGFLWLISVGDDAVISAGVRVLAHDAAPKALVGKSLIAPVSIGSRVYIGAGAIVLPGVTIGDEAIIGAGSVVRRDVGPRTIVAGNPAREIGSVDDYQARHEAERQQRPNFPADGWTQRRGITPEREEEMRRKLQDGWGYID